MIKMSAKELSEKLTDDTVFILKQDLKTENHTFRAGTRVMFEEKYRTMYHDTYTVYSADRTDYMYIHRTEELEELAENILETDTDRTEKYRKFLSETHINVSAIITVALYVAGFAALSVFLWKSDTSMSFTDMLFLTVMMLGMMTADIFSDMMRLHKENATELVYKRKELLL